MVHQVRAEQVVLMEVQVLQVRAEQVEVAEQADHQEHRDLAEQAD